MLKDTVICDSSGETRTHKVFNALDEICYQWDLSRPLWLDNNISEFKRLAKTRFRSDNFIDSIAFDYLESRFSRRIEVFPETKNIRRRVSSFSGRFCFRQQDQTASSSLTSRTSC